MANVNRVVAAPGKSDQPKFASSSCKYGTIGADSEGDLWMWTGTSYAINLRSGQGLRRGDLEDLGITSLRPFSVLELSVNEEQ